jgi:hypothetical protein
MKTFSLWDYFDPYDSIFSWFVNPLSAFDVSGITALEINGIYGSRIDGFWEQTSLHGELLESFIVRGLHNSKFVAFSQDETSVPDSPTLHFH